MFRCLRQAAADGQRREPRIQHGERLRAGRSSHWRRKTFPYPRYFGWPTRSIKQVRNLEIRAVRSTVHLKQLAMPGSTHMRHPRADCPSETSVDAMPTDLWDSSINVRSSPQRNKCDNFSGFRVT